MARIDRTSQRAIKIGRQQAQEILQHRKRALRSRANALKRREAFLEREMPAKVITLPEAPVAGTSGVLVAEGDSWFDYPLNDVLQLLEDHYGYDVESVAHYGDAVEDMAYAGQLEKFTSALEKLLRRNIVPKAVLLSGGGNDVAGNEFSVLLNHARSVSRGLNKSVVDGVVNQRIREAYTTILSAVTRLCEEKIRTRLPLLVHGYDYPVPDGRGFAGGWWLLPGPWLEPGFRKKGYMDIAERIRTVRSLIDCFNEMLIDVTGLQPFSHVKFIDLRRTLSNGADYRKWWANELHPSPRGFEAVTQKFVAVLDKLPVLQPA